MQEEKEEEKKEKEENGRRKRKRKKERRKDGREVEGEKEEKKKKATKQRISWSEEKRCLYIRQTFFVCVSIFLSVILSFIISFSNVIPDNVIVTYVSAGHSLEIQVDHTKREQFSDSTSQDNLMGVLALLKSHRGWEDGMFQYNLADTIQHPLGWTCDILIVDTYKDVTRRSLRKTPPAQLMQLSG